MKHNPALVTILVLFVIQLALLIPACCTRHPEHGIPNFAKVEKGIWRGGQPDVTGFRYLKSLGVKRIIKLNTKHEALDTEAVALGMEVVWIPITLAQQTISKPVPADLQSAVASMVEGTYVHCQHGDDRTGLVIAAYRIDVEEWSKPKAYAEMLKYGFHPMLRGLMWSFEDDLPFK